MNKLFDWHRRNPKLFLWISIAILFLGLLFSFVIPSLAKSSAFNSAEAAILNANVEVSSASQQLSSQEMWFLPRYLEGLPEALSSAGDLVQEAEEALDQANRKSSVTKSIRLAKEAESKADKATAIINQVQLVLAENANLQTRAYKDQTSTADLLISAMTIFENSQKRFNAEEKQYLKKYTAPLSEKIDEARVKIDEANVALNVAANYLPFLDSKDRLGDPIAAQEKIDRAKILIDSINSLMGEVTAGLDYLAEAESNAQAKAIEARGNYANSFSYVFDLKSRNGYWLVVSTTALENAEADAKLAEVTLGVLIEGEGLIDYPAAYEAALRAINFSAQAVQEADNEVATAARANQKIAEIKQSFAGVENRLQEVQAVEQNLDRYHADEVWSNVKGSASFVENKISLAKEDLSMAEKNISLQVQRFAEAEAKADAGLLELQSASSLIQKIVDLNDYLESKRFAWPAAESSASSEIESNRSQVSRYGSYSYSAKNDWNSAVDLLNAAKTDATYHRYESAVSKANEAESLASGTGARAERAYDDEMARQERERREAEEAAERAAEEAARQLLESSSSSSSSSDWDSSSSSGGGWDSSSSSSGDGYDFSDYSSSGDGGDW